MPDVAANAEAASPTPRQLRPLLALRPYIARYPYMVVAALAALILSAATMLTVPPV